MPRVGPLSPKIGDHGSPSIYLRLSVTDRCNLHCSYCKPQNVNGQACTLPRLSLSEMIDLVGLIHEGSNLRKIRLTGGEPLLRSDLEELVQRLRDSLPETELCLTTNGTLLAGRAKALRLAGVDTINISMDAASPENYRAVTGGGDLSEVRAGLRAAQEAGFDRIKLNVVLLRTMNGTEITHLIRGAGNLGCEIRFIELMPIGPAARIHEREYLPATEVLPQLQSEFSDITKLEDSGTSRRFLIREGSWQCKVGFITPASAPFCTRCDRLRLDSFGRMYRCLRDEHAEDLGELLRAGLQREVVSRVRLIAANKCAPMAQWPHRSMLSVGG